MRMKWITESSSLRGVVLTALVVSLFTAACAPDATSPSVEPVFPAAPPSPSAGATAPAVTPAGPPTYLVLHRTAQSSGLSGGRLAATGTRSDLALLSGSVISTLDVDVTNWSLSPDATRIAYWKAASAGDPPNELRVLGWTGGTTPVTVSRLSGERGDAIAWSTDGRGLLYSVISQQIVSPTTGQAAYTAVRATQIGSGVVRELARRSEGSILTPLAWLSSTGEFVAQDGSSLRIGPALERQHSLPEGFRVSRVTMSGDMSLAFALGTGGEIALIRTTSGELLGRWTSPSDVQDIVTGPGAARWAVALVDGVQLWTSQGPEHSLDGEDGPATAFFSVDGGRVGRAAYPAAGAQVQLWTVRGDPVLRAGIPSDVRPLAVK